MDVEPQTSKIKDRTGVIDVIAHDSKAGEVVLVMKTREGTRELRFGREYRVRRSAGLDAELDALLGAAIRAA